MPRDAIEVIKYSGLADVFEPEDQTWDGGLKQGKGIITYAFGNVYVGDWKDDKKQGKGKYIWVDGRVYEGDYINDKRQGKGKYTLADGDVQYMRETLWMASFMEKENTVGPMEMCMRETL